MTCAIETRQLPRQRVVRKLVHVLTTFVMSRRTTLLTTLRTTFLRLPSPATRGMFSSLYGLVRSVPARQSLQVALYP